MASNDGRHSDLRVGCSLGIGYEDVKWLAMIGTSVTFVLLLFFRYRSGIQIQISHLTFF